MGRVKMQIPKRCPKCNKPMGIARKSIDEADVRVQYWICHNPDCEYEKLQKITCGLWRKIDRMYNRPEVIL